MRNLQYFFEQLKALTDIPSISGFEQGIVKKIYRELKPAADKMEVGKIPQREN